LRVSAKGDVKKREKEEKNTVTGIALGKPEGE